MSRFKQWTMGLIVVGLAGASGCAQCDTCDDFPAPCTGPNCAQGNGGGGQVYQPVGFIPPTMGGTDVREAAVNTQTGALPPGASSAAPSPNTPEMVPPTPSSNTPPAPTSPGI